MRRTLFWTDKVISFQRFGIKLVLLRVTTTSNGETIRKLLQSSLLFPIFLPSTNVIYVLSPTDTRKEELIVAKVIVAAL